MLRARQKPPTSNEPVFEAMAADLSPRGESRVYCGKLFPPGEWVPITAREARLLRFKAVQIRPMEGD